MTDLLGEVKLNPNLTRPVVVATTCWVVFVLSIMLVGLVDSRVDPLLVGLGSTAACGGLLFTIASSVAAFRGTRPLYRVAETELHLPIHPTIFFRRQRTSFVKTAIVPALISVVAGTGHAIYSRFTLLDFSPWRAIARVVVPPAFILLGTVFLVLVVQNIDTSHARIRWRLPNVCILALASVSSAILALFANPITLCIFTLASGFLLLRLRRQTAPYFETGDSFGTQKESIWSTRKKLGLANLLTSRNLRRSLSLWQWQRIALFRTGRFFFRVEGFWNFFPTMMFFLAFTNGLPRILFPLILSNIIFQDKINKNIHDLFKQIDWLPIHRRSVLAVATLVPTTGLTLIVLVGSSLEAPLVKKVSDNRYQTSENIKRFAYISLRPQPPQQLTTASSYKSSYPPVQLLGLLPFHIHHPFDTQPTGKDSNGDMSQAETSIILEKYLLAIHNQRIPRRSITEGLSNLDKGSGLKVGEISSGTGIQVKVFASLFILNVLLINWRLLLDLPSRRRPSILSVALDRMYTFSAWLLLAALIVAFLVSPVLLTIRFLYKIFLTEREIPFDAWSEVNAPLVFQIQAHMDLLSSLFTFHPLRYAISLSFALSLIAILQYWNLHTTIDQIDLAASRADFERT